MALILAILEDRSIPHPALEAVFTTDEEVGLTGAENFDSSQLQGDTPGSRSSRKDAETRISFCSGCSITSTGRLICI